MCGIFGTHGIPDHNLFNRMGDLLNHRGPDDSGIYQDKEAKLNLGMRRLEIIDVDGGKQPMISPCGRYALVYNGEIVNAPELRKELKEQGYQFDSSHSDTEVFFKTLIQYGVDGIAKFNGMFAFAFYDKQSQVLTCGRDRFGIKPFYYFCKNGRFAFSSEMKSLLAASADTRELNTQSLFHYLSLLYVPGPQTIFQNVQRLGAGELLSYCCKKKNISVKKWWKPKFVPEKGRSERFWQEEVRSTLSTAVRRWVVADVPVACSLSGGLDSSSIVSLLSQQGSPPKTYSLGFEGEGENEWNELPIAASVSKKWGTEHREIILPVEKLLDDIVDMVWALDEPYGGGLPSWYVYSEMSKDVKVCLTGTGGDELFGNYGKWRPMEGGKIRRMLQRSVSPKHFQECYFNKYSIFMDADKKFRVLGSIDQSVNDTSTFMEKHFFSGNAKNVRDQVAEMEIPLQLNDEFLTMTDRFSMHHSLEARPPFLDNELFDLVARIPSCQRTKIHDYKSLLRNAMKPVLPEKVLSAPKRGFVLPLRTWLQEKLLPLCRMLLDPNRLKKQGIFRPTFYNDFVTPHIEGKMDNTSKIWAVIMFQLWHLVYIDGVAKKPDFTLHDLMKG